MVGGGGQSDVARGEAAAGRNHGVAGGKVLAGAADVTAGGDCLVHPHLGAGGGRVLLQQDGIGAMRHDAAGEQADDLAGADSALERVAGRGAADDVQFGAECTVGGAQGVAVHRRDIGRRLGQAGDHRRGGDAAPGIGECDDLRRGGAKVGQDAFAGFLDADHAGVPC